MTAGKPETTQRSTRKPSTHVSARYPKGCTTCGAGVGDPCRSLTTGRVTDTHRARIDASYPNAL